MILPKAELLHSIADRVRIRIPSRRHRRQYFEEVEAGLREFSDVHAVATNPLTGSVLITHRSPLNQLADFARSKGLFDLQMVFHEEPPQEALSKKMVRNFKQIDRKVRERTHGSSDLPSVLAVGLLGAAIFQISRGRLFPPALTLLDNAMRIVRNAD